MKIVAFKLENGEYIPMGNLRAVSLEDFLHKVKTEDVETIVFGEIDDKGKRVWEKNFTGGTAMPREFTDRIGKSSHWKK